MACSFYPRGGAAFDDFEALIPSVPFDPGHLPLKRSRTGMDIDLNFPVSAPSGLERPEQQSEVRHQGTYPNVLT